MEEREALRIFGDARAIVTGDHFVYTSGRHGSVYVNKDAVYPSTALVSRLCYGLAEQSGDVDTVIGLANGGIILSQWTAYHLSYILGKHVHSVYAEQGDGDAIVKRGFPEFVRGKRVFAVEDIVTTGASARNLISAVRKIGGEVTGLGALCNRGGVTAEHLGDPPVFKSLVTVSAESWPESECPLCRDGIPVNTELGHGRNFLVSRASS